MKQFRRLAVASALLAFALAVLGSWVRINDAGMTCPDWPLCNGRIVPSLAGGVVLEWSHRTVAFIEGFVVLATIVAGRRVREAIAGVGPALSALGGIFLVQVLLGGATVHLANSPLSVMLHWGVGMLFLGDLAVLAALGVLRPAPAAARGRSASTIALSLAAAAAFATMCLGAYVSSSYAGLACATFPRCDGTWLGTNALQAAQMLHRFAAGGFAAIAVVATGVAARRGAVPAARLAAVGLALTLGQVALGALNVLLALPTLLREAHAANAAATFLAFVLAATSAAYGPTTHRPSVRRTAARRSQAIA